MPTGRPRGASSPSRWCPPRPLACRGDTAPPARSAARLQRLDDDSLVPCGDRGLEEGGGLTGVAGDQAGHPQGRWQDRSRRRVPLGTGQVEEVAAVEVEDVEEEWGQRDRLPQAAHVS